MRGVLIMVSLITGIPAVVLAPPARADDTVLYEVLSGYVHSVNVEYYDHSELISLRDVPLPWRATATVTNPSSQSTDGAQLHVHWRPADQLTRVTRNETEETWATIRIYVRGSLICQSTADSGEAACYGDRASLSGL